MHAACHSVITRTARKPSILGGVRASVLFSFHCQAPAATMPTSSSALVFCSVVTLLASTSAAPLAPQAKMVLADFVQNPRVCNLLCNMLCNMLCNLLCTIANCTNHII